MFVCQRRLLRRRRAGLAVLRVLVRHRLCRLRTAPGVTTIAAGDAPFITSISSTAAAGDAPFVTSISSTAANPASAITNATATFTAASSAITALAAATAVPSDVAGWSARDPPPTAHAATIAIPAATLAPAVAITTSTVTISSAAVATAAAASPASPASCARDHVHKHMFVCQRRLLRRRWPELVLLGLLVRQRLHRLWLAHGTVPAAAAATVAFASITTIAACPANAAAAAAADATSLLRQPGMARLRAWCVRSVLSAPDYRSRVPLAYAYPRVRYPRPYRSLLRGRRRVRNQHAAE